MSSFGFCRAKHIRLGKKGEKIACSLLKNKNYNILCKNYRSKSGEIDIVARDGATLCFVEVKTRHSSKLANNIHAPWVGYKQTERIKKAAKDYMYKVELLKIKYRFELIEVTMKSYGVAKISHWLHNFGRES